MIALSVSSLTASETDVIELPPFQVTTNRLWQDLDTLKALNTSWDQQSITQTTPRTIDQVLYQEPSFSFFRRQNSLFAAPQTQGVSLRSIGATAAPRTLVLRDGIPQNDPFGGWVPWARYTPRNIESVQILPGKQAASWGNQSSGGVILIDSLRPENEVHQAQLTIGSFSTIAADTQHSFSSGKHAFSVNLMRSESDGDYLIHSSDRGPIDEQAGFETLGIDVSHHFQINQDLRLESSVSYYDEERVNGTPATYYNTEALDLSLRLVGSTHDKEWSASLYYQDRTLESLFSSVNASRTAETPVLDQFDIPADGIGGNFVIASDDFDNIRVVTGVDIRHLTGETNEDVLIPNRRRVAGGEQTLGGLFFKLGNQPERATSYELNLRLDHWSLNQGSRTETSNASGVVSLDAKYRDRSDWEPSVSFSAAHELTERVTLDVGSAYTFRLPTINELYRPFRVGDDITEANPELDPERFLSLDAALNWEASDRFTINSGLFHYWISDAIANVRTTAPTGVFVPTGGSYSERQNVNSATVFGWQSSIEFRPSDALTVAVNYLYTHTEFTDSNIQSSLEGNAFPQVPTHKATLRADYQFNSALQIFGTLEYGSSQYDDPLNSRKLPDFVTGQIGASYQVTEQLRLTARIDNLADATILTGERSDGTRSIAPGRSFWLTAQIDW